MGWRQGWAEKRDYGKTYPKTWYLNQNLKDEWESGEEWGRSFQAKKLGQSPGGVKELGVFKEYVVRVE